MAAVARTAARNVRARGAARAAHAPRGGKEGIRADARVRAGRLDQAANVAAITRGRVGVNKDIARGDTRPAITAIVVITGIEFLNTWLVDKRTLPTRRYFIRLAVLGFMLALLTEVTPKVGKSMSYLIMTAVIFQRSGRILKALDTNSRKPTAEPEGATPSPTLPTGDTRFILYNTGGLSPTAPPIPARVQLRRPQRGVGTAT